MPTYEYACPRGHDFELFQKMSDKPRARCPVCGAMAVRQISGGAGLHFKGSGFYITDYGKDGKGPRNDKARESSETSAAGASSDTGKAGGETKAADASGAQKKSEPAAPTKGSKATGGKSSAKRAKSE